MNLMPATPSTFSFLNGHLRIDRDEILARCRPAEGDIVVLSGTLVEGIGNKHSDIDVYVICDELPPVRHTGDHSFFIEQNGGLRTFVDYIREDGVAFDVEYYTRAEVEAMKDDVLALYQLARRGTKTLRKKLPLSSEDALHKMQVGITVTGSSEFVQLFPTDFWEKLSFVQYRNRTGGYPEFKDLMGTWGSGDFDTSLLVCTMFLMDQAAGLCHLAGSTNAKPKWVMQNLKRLPEPLRPLGQEVIAWYGSAGSAISDRKAAVLAACELMTKIYEANTALLNASGDIFYSAEEALRLTQEEFMREPFHDPQTVLEFEFRRLLFNTGTRSVREFLVQNV
ncbi:MULTISPECIES: hypothetical protein [unclassified Agrobacterium]|uniref:hypothetical protein n=1 Tax=unclassified Agrobacterium TaxID=2632611 RepID=UPI0003760056|nr:MULTISPECIES: hypothetical protein [unclassified Agrobacterium]SNB75063.1 hypothetical protein SAMN05661103_3958 [Agrobacterium sp. 719_389]